MSAATFSCAPAVYFEASTAGWTISVAGSRRVDAGQGAVGGIDALDRVQHRSQPVVRRIELARCGLDRVGEGGGGLANRVERRGVRVVGARLGVGGSAQLGEPAEPLGERVSLRVGIGSEPVGRIGVCVQGARHDAGARAGRPTHEIGGVPGESGMGDYNESNPMLASIHLLQPHLLSLLRIVSSLVLFSYGTQKILHFPAAASVPPVGSMSWFAGMLELVLGFLDFFLYRVVEDMLQQANPQDYWVLPFIAAICLIWIAYFRRSRRVANTFRSQEEADRQLSEIFS